MIRIRISAAVLALAVTSLRAEAQELVTNGGFETGSFSGWNLAGNCSTFTDVFSAGPQHSGTYGAASGPIGSTCTISQDLATTVGQQYTFSFWVRNLSEGTNSFQALFGAQSVYSVSNSAAFAYTEQFFAVTATSVNTTIAFVIRHDPSRYYFDDVSVVAANTTVPEPSTYALMAAGLLGIVAARRRRSA